MFLTNATLFRADATGSNINSSGGIVEHGAWTTVLNQPNPQGTFYSEFFLSTVAAPGSANFLSPAASLSVALGPGAHTVYFWADGDDTLGGSATFGLNLFLNGAGTLNPSISAYVTPGLGQPVSANGSTVCTAGFDMKCANGAGRLSFAVNGSTVTLSDFNVLGVGGAAASSSCIDLVNTGNPFVPPPHPDGICDTYGQFILTISTPQIQQILPQLAFGGGWYTAVYFTNTSANAVSFPVNFVANDGTALTVPSVGGPSTTVNLAPRGTAIIEAPNVGPLLQGYVSVSLPAGVVGYGIFRATTSGRGDQEAVVPLSGVSSTTSTLIWDDTNFVTAVAIVNPSSVNTTIAITVRDMKGAIIGTSSVPLVAKSKVAVALRDLPGLAAMAGQRGSADFTVAFGNVAVLGLRFSAIAFTSIPTADR